MESTNFPTVMPALYLHSYPVECVSVTFTHEEDDEIKVPPEVRVYAVVSDAEHKVLFVKFFYSKKYVNLAYADSACHIRMFKFK